MKRNTYTLSIIAFVPSGDKLNEIFIGEISGERGTIAHVARLIGFTLTSKTVCGLTSIMKPHSLTAVHNVVDFGKTSIATEAYYSEHLFYKIELA